AGHVDRVLDRDEPRAALLQRLVRMEKVQYPPSEPVHLPDHHGVEAACGKQRRATLAVFGPTGGRGDSVIDELADDLPAASLRVPAAGLELASDRDGLLLGDA